MLTAIIYHVIRIKNKNAIGKRLLEVKICINYSIEILQDIIKDDAPYLYY